MTSPLIGITTWRDSSQTGASQICASETYIQAILRAGASPIMIPLGIPDQFLRQILPRIDGVLFTGGGDVHPESYGSHPHPSVSLIDRDRDRTEFLLIQEIVEHRKPFLGICRGIQVINTGLGGTLYEDILDQKPGAIKHDYFTPEWPGGHLAHPIVIESTSRLHKIMGTDELLVNSLHHQGIKQLAPGLVATAVAPDGLIEAFELPGYPFGIAVQWHPERLTDDSAMEGIFQAFALAASK
jgi:putative glutamine amidotransferase